MRDGGDVRDVRVRLSSPERRSEDGGYVVGMYTRLVGKSGGPSVFASLNVSVRFRRYEGS